MIERIAGEYGLSLVLLFGSEASGKAHKNSDLDIAVMFEQSAFDRARLLDLVNVFAGVFQERKIDLGLINGADPLFLKKLLESCKLIHGDPRVLAELKIYAYKRYIDHKRFLKMEDDYIKRLLDRYEKGAA